MPDTRQYVRIENETLDVVLKAMNRGGRLTDVRLEADGTIRSHGVLVGVTITTNRERPVALEEDRTLRHQVVLYDAGGNQIRALAEATGEQRIMLTGYDGAAIQRLRTETTRELTVTLHGKDSAANVDPLRTDTSQILRTREFEPYTWIAPGNVVAAAPTTFYTVPANLVARFRVYLFNAGAANVTTMVARVPSGGAVGTTNYLWYGPVPANGSIELPEQILHAGGTVQAQRIAGGADTDVTIHIYAEEYRGDTA